MDSIIIIIIIITTTTTLLYHALCYKLAGHGFDYRWCHWNFSV